MNSEKSEPERISLYGWMKYSLSLMQEIFPDDYFEAATELFGELGYRVEKVEQ